MMRSTLVHYNNLGASQLKSGHLDASIQSFKLALEAIMKCLRHSTLSDKTTGVVAAPNFAPDPQRGSLTAAAAGGESHTRPVLASSKSEPQSTSARTANSQLEQEDGHDRLANSVVRQGFEMAQVHIPCTHGYIFADAIRLPKEETPALNATGEASDSSSNTSGADNSTSSGETDSSPAPKNWLQEHLDSATVLFNLALAYDNKSATLLSSAATTQTTDNSSRRPVAAGSTTSHELAASNDQCRSTDDNDTETTMTQHLDLARKAAKFYDLCLQVLSEALLGLMAQEAAPPFMAKEPPLHPLTGRKNYACHAGVFAAAFGSTSDRFLKFALHHKLAIVALNNIGLLHVRIQKWNDDEKQIGNGNLGLAAAYFDHCWRLVQPLSVSEKREMFGEQTLQGILTNICRYASTTTTMGLSIANAACAA